MTNFETALNVVLHHEGGFVDNPDDKGGPTNFGITLGAYREFTGHPVSMADIHDLTPAQVAAFYRHLWDVGGTDAVDSSIVATVLFDQAILEGAKAVAMRAQQILGLAVDGQLGPLTYAAINRENPECFAFKFIRASVHYYTRIVEHDSTQAQFLSGWIDRLMSLLDFTFLGDFT